MEAGSILDVCGIVDSVEPWAIITRKDGSETRKRSLAIRDDSGRSVEVSGEEGMHQGEEDAPGNAKDGSSGGGGERGHGVMCARGQQSGNIRPVNSCLLTPLRRVSLTLLCWRCATATATCSAAPGDPVGQVCHGWRPRARPLAWRPAGAGGAAGPEASGGHEGG